MSRNTRLFVIALLVFLALGTLFFGAQKIFHTIPFGNSQQLAAVDSSPKTIVLQDGLSGYSGTQDTYMYSFTGYTLLNYGASKELLSSPAEAFVPLVRFAIFQSEGGPVPNGATITSATLALYKSSGYDTVFQAQRLLKDWKEMEESWQKATSATSWSTSGALGSGTDIASGGSQVTAAWNPGWVTFDVTSDVKAFASGSDYGWRISTVSGNINTKIFYSRESAMANQRPQLTLTYTTTDAVGAATPPSTPVVTSAPAQTSVPPPSVATPGSLNISITGDFAFTNQNCSLANLKNLKNCLLSIVFKPTAPGTRTGTLSITNTESNQTKTVALQGVGMAAQAPATTPTLAPTVTLTTSANSVTSGNATTLTWSSANATSCTASNGWSGSKATSGTQSTGALSTATTFSLSCTGAGGSASQSVLVGVTQQTSQPLPTTPVNIPAGVFTAILAPAKGFGIATAGGMKHVGLAIDPDNGRIYAEAGDYSGLAYEQSYRQETYSFSLTDRLANLSNANAGWRLEYPYCGPVGQMQPKHPDFVGWTWDSKRHIFWMVPGQMDDAGNELCPGETNDHKSNPGFLLNSLMTFDPVAQKWSSPGAPSPLTPSTDQWASVYDPKTDSLVRFSADGNGGWADIYTISTNTWSRFFLGYNAVQGDVRMYKQGVSADLDARVIYSVDGIAGRLYQYNMDTKKVLDLGSVPDGPFAGGSANDDYVAWDKTDGILYHFRPDTNKLYIYHPDTKTWELPSMQTNPSDIQVTARHAMIYDPVLNVLVMMGGTNPFNPYIFLYRYSSSAATQTPPATPPATPPSTPPATTNIVAGAWTALSNTILRTVCPANSSSYPFYDACHNVVDAWSGGTVDTLRNRLIVWGGGHGDYSGNEIYAVNVDTQNITRLTDPSVVPPNWTNPTSSTCLASFPDGNPNSRHTYGQIAYIAHADKLFIEGGSFACGSGGGHDDTWTFDFKTSKWQNMNPSGSTPGYVMGGLAVYDPATKLVYFHDTNSLFSYNVDTNTYQRLTLNQYQMWLDYHMSAALDTKRHKLVIIGEGGDTGTGPQSNGYTGGVIVYDVTPGGGYTFQKWATTGGDAIVNTAVPGLAYDPVSDRIIAWHGGSDLYSLNMDTKVWTKITPTGDPGAAVTTGTYGRFGYVPALNEFVVLNSVYSPAYLLKFAPGTIASNYTNTTLAAANLTSAPQGFLAGLWHTVTSFFGQSIALLFRNSGAQLAGAAFDVTAASLNFGSVTLDTTSSTQTLTLNYSDQGTVSTPVVNTISNTGNGTSADSNNPVSSPNTSSSKTVSVVSSAVNSGAGSGTTGSGSNGNTTSSPQKVSSFLISLPLGPGMQHTDVALLQQVLAKDSTLYPEGLVTGYYGAATQNAVQRFQVRYGIVSSGTPSTTGYGSVGPKTIQKLQEVYGTTTVSTITTTPSVTTTTQSATTVTFTYVRPLRIGATGADVSALQKFLAKDPTLYPEGLVTGYYGAATQRAVQRFQARYGIVSSGTPITTGYGAIGPKTGTKLQGISL